MRTIYALIAIQLAMLVAIVILSCSGDHPAPPPVRLATPDGPVVSTELDVLLAADAGDCKPINGCCYPPSWPSQQGACSCVDATGKGCVWDETCPVGLHCSTLHPVLAADAGLQPRPAPRAVGR